MAIQTKPAFAGYALVRVGGLRLCSRDFQSLGIFSKLGCSHALPVKIQNTEVKAEYKNGILNLTLPKKEEEKNRVVKVNLDSAAA